MLAKVYLFEDPGFRTTDYITGTRREIDEKLMVYRVRNILGGYHIYDYEDYDEYLQDNSFQWQRREVHRWFDREAIIQNNSYGPWTSPKR